MSQVHVELAHDPCPEQLCSHTPNSTASRQSEPMNPGSQTQVPFRQAPRPLQLDAQPAIRASEQSLNIQPTSQAHVPLRQDPCPLQLFLHGTLTASWSDHSHSDPANPESQTQDPRMHVPLEVQFLLHRPPASTVPSQMHVPFEITPLPGVQLAAHIATASAMAALAKTSHAGPDHP